MLTLVKKNRDDILSALKMHKLLKIINHDINTTEDLIHFSLALGELLPWDFGVVNELRFNPKAENYLYSNEAVPYHWDGAFAKSPYLLVFHCIKAPPVNAGGETLFANCQSILDSLTPKEYQILASAQLVYETEKKAHYGGIAKTPAIIKHPIFHYPTLRYAEPVITSKNPVSLTMTNINSDECQFIQQLMKEKLYNSEYAYSHSWKDNDLIIADNHALLHGRNAFIHHYPRHIRRVQVLHPTRNA